MIDPVTLNILSNLATDLIKYSGNRFLNSTLAGTKLKEKIGVLDSTSEDEFKKILLETYVTYFSKYPDRQFQVFYNFYLLIISVPFCSKENCSPELPRPLPE